ncbi:accessory colonization factor AcfC [Polaromonas sp. CG_9.5]|uniref:substrate-binding domain-containing protein n=1 Tax=Polaromonas sp. CG_9.5 TaxID=3071705 RepID=UPI002E02F862|nr:accessory colonization factor AcfC [Polaromonas sp. CG_9.5]
MNFAISLFARRTLALLTLSLAAAAPGFAATLNVYGPGGPAPAMKEAAKSFGLLHGVDVNVTAGPTGQWSAQAKQDADVVFSGAENMMSDFAKALPGTFDLAAAEPLYLRPVAILVRPGNPQHIQGFRDLLKPGIKVLAVAGAGQTGLWEDIAGRTGDIGLVRAFRKNLLLPEAANSAEARKQWTQQPEIDAWLIWNIWQVSNPDLAQLVPMDEPFRIYRDVGVVITRRGGAEPHAKAFVDYLKSPAGQAIFVKWGWTAP